MFHDYCFNVIQWGSQAPPQIILQFNSEAASTQYEYENTR